MTRISRQEHASLYGGTTGDRIRLGDTDLYIEIERDLRTPGDEVVFGGGKSIREGMGLDNEATSTGGAPDLVITNVTIVDAVLGVVKADVGVKDGRICGIGKAGNPSTMDGVTPSLVIGNATDAIAGEHLLLTAGGIDTHIHFISPQQVYAGLSNGVTTFFGGGTGPSDGTNATTVTPGPWNIARMLEAAEGLPVNVGFLGKGHAHGRAPLVEQIEAGAVGFKCHEDWGTTPAVIRSALTVADEMDVQVCIHTDTLNESGFVEDTIAAFENRTIHTFHTEGSGGGHAPDIIRVAALPNVLPSSTNPTLPYGINTQAELFDMIMVCHHLNPDVASDVAFAESRIRAETIAAENVLHDLGVISMFSSDSQAMGRAGECWLRAIQTADAMKKGRGKLPGDSARNDNFRVLRYVAKITINPAIAQGIGTVLGSVEVGKFADLVLWDPRFFGAKPKLIVKGGMVNSAIMGDPNASLPTPQPVYYRPMFGAHGRALASTCITFVSGAAFDNGIGDRLGLARRVMPVRDIRKLGKRDMVRNDATPSIDVDPETFAVKVDGVHATVAPLSHIALNQMYFFSLMIVIEAVLGNVSDAPWRERLAGATQDALALDHWEGQKNRFRKRTAAGTEIAVSLDRGAFLRDGDILRWDEATRTAVVARISLRDVMIVHLDEIAGAAPELVVRACVELGHALGNQHWPALVKGTRVFVPLTVDRKVMASVMNTHRFEHMRYEFVPGADIIPYLAPHESRRLFGGAEGPVHSHVYDPAIPPSRAPVPSR